MSGQSRLPSEVTAQLDALLRDLVSSDNARRSDGETRLNEQWLKQQPQYLLAGLAVFGNEAQDQAVREENVECL